MNSFTEGQRVKVKKAEDGSIVNRIGVVTRCRVGDNGAWVQLDRVKILPDGQKVQKVLAYPKDCQPAKDTRRARREAAVENSRIVPTIDQFGKDHWSTFGYIECRIVDNCGEPNRLHMRCHPGRHPLLAHSGSRMGGTSPTRRSWTKMIRRSPWWPCFARTHVRWHKSRRAQACWTSPKKMKKGLLADAAPKPQKAGHHGESV